MSNRKLAVGWFDNMPFQHVCAPYLERLKEVFFAWPGVTASRPMDDWTEERRAQIISDLRWARENGVELDTSFKAICHFLVFVPGPRRTGRKWEFRQIPAVCETAGNARNCSRQLRRTVQTPVLA